MQQLFLYVRSHKSLLFALLIAAFLLMLPALYNGFPLVTSDSGAYIGNAWELMVPLDRPLGYSLFIRLSSLGLTLWGCICVQALILSVFIQLITSYLLGRRYTHSLFFVVILLLVFATSSAWFCSQLMPDIFTAILLLGILVWYFIPLKHPWAKYLLLLFLFCVLMVHNSHPLILALFSLIMILYSIIKKNPLWKKAVVLLSMCMVALLGFSAMNAVSGKGFRPSAASGVFLMCRLVESGVMDKFLAENCAQNDYKLCAYREQLPNRQWIFMWDPAGPLYKTGGWQANEEEYLQIEKKIMTTPKYLALFIFKSLQASFRQLTGINVGDGLSPQKENSSPYVNIEKYHRTELKEYSASLQSDGGLNWMLFTALIVVATFLLAIGALLLNSFRREGLGAEYKPWRSFFYFTILYLGCNAAVTATFSTVLGRFGSRVFWVLPFLCILYILKALADTISRKAPATLDGYDTE